MTIRGGGDPTDHMGYQAAIKNGTAAPELRRRCALLHHGLDPSRIRRIQVRDAMIPLTTVELPSDKKAEI